MFRTRESSPPRSDGSSMPELRRTHYNVCLSSGVGRFDFAEKVFELIFVRDWLEAENTYFFLVE